MDAWMHGCMASRSEEGRGRERGGAGVLEPTDVERRDGTESVKGGSGHPCLAFS